MGRMLHPCLVPGADSHSDVPARPIRRHALSLDLQRLFSRRTLYSGDVWSLARSPPPASATSRRRSIPFSGTGLNQSVSIRALGEESLADAIDSACIAI